MSVQSRVSTTTGFVCLAVFFVLNAGAQALQSNYHDWERSGLRGDTEAIATAKVMVGTMGGMEIWGRLKSIHFVHEWNIASRIDRYIENETLDFTGPRSLVTMESEIYHRIRAYSPEYKYWNVINGEFSFAPDTAWQNAMERAPYSIYRLANAIASGNSYYHVEFANLGSDTVRQLDFKGPDDELHGSIVLNARNEPIVWATTQYTYEFGPLARYGNIWVPKWAITGDGAVNYELISVKGSMNSPLLSRFAPPESDMSPDTEE